MFIYLFCSFLGIFVISDSGMVFINPSVRMWIYKEKGKFNRIGGQEIPDERPKNLLDPFDNIVLKIRQNTKQQ